MAAIVHEQATNGPYISSNDGSSCFREGLNYPSPCPGKIPAVISAAARSNNPPFTMSLGQLTKPSGCQRVRLLRVAKIRDRVALETVGPALQDYELGFSGIDKRFHSFPGLLKFPVTR